MLNKFSDFNNVRIHKKAFYGLSFTILCYISLFVFYNVRLEFDGAFHTQCAINLFKHGTYALNYGDSSYIQTKLPFQLINGFFLMVCGISFSAANLANILFYIFLWLFIRRLFQKYDTGLLFISFIAISFNTCTLKFAFQGFGEMPALVFALWGLYYSAFYQKSTKHLFLSGALIGSAIATKWVLVLALAPFSLIISHYLFSRDFRSTGIIVAGFIVSLMSFLSIEYYFTQASVSATISGIAGQSSGASAIFHQTYTERLTEFWVAYTQSAGGDTIVAIKLILMVIVAIPMVLIGIKFLKSLGNGKTISPEQIFYLQIASFLFVYFFWWFVLGSKPWYRRLYNADALLYICVALCYSQWKFIFTRQQYLKFLLPVFMAVTIGIFATNFYNKNTGRLYFSTYGSSSDDSAFKSALSMLPQDYTAYGHGWWQAPRWSFFSQKHFLDITSLTASQKDSLYNGYGNHFIFFDAENKSCDLPSYQRMHELYDLQPIYSCGGYEIKKILSVKNTNKKALLNCTIFSQKETADVSKASVSFIDYSKNDEDVSVGLYKREQNRFKWSQQNSSIPLKSGEFNYFSAKFYIHDIGQYPDDMSICVFFNGDFVYRKVVFQSGFINAEFPVDSIYKNKSIVVSMQASSFFTPINDSRNVSFVVHSIGFVNHNDK